MTARVWELKENISIRFENPNMKYNFSSQDRKAAKTLSAILLAFIVTWTPYRSKLGRYLVIMLWFDICVHFSVLTVLKGLQLEEGIPKTLWDFSYYLCYINSTVNPVCIRVTISPSSLLVHLSSYFIPRLRILIHMI